MKGGKWQVCVDYTDLNKACPKDIFPLPHIDQIVDTAIGHRILSFLDAFSRYHQIPMYPPDSEKTAFITLHGLYFYTVMPFGLKNVGATYQRLVTKIFRPLLGNTMEAYIDDMLAKSNERFDHTKHLQEAFKLLRRYGMKLNPLKCAFGVSAGNFLGFMVTQKRIVANLLQLKIIMESQTSTSKKGVQQLTSQLAALGRFISLFINRLKPFFTTLKGVKGADGNEECDQALMAIKQYLIEPPILASSETRDTLYLYLVVLEVSASATLFKEDENQKQRPVFFIIKSLA